MTPTSKPAVTPEMVEKARQFYAQDVGVGAANYATEVGRLEGQVSYRIELMARFAASAVQDAVRDCIAIVENEPELEGPIPNYIRSLMLKQSLEDQQRGAVRATKKSIAAALREKYGVTP